MFQVLLLVLPIGQYCVASAQFSTQGTYFYVATSAYESSSHKLTLTRKHSPVQKFHRNSFLFSVRGGAKKKEPEIEEEEVEEDDEDEGDDMDEDEEGESKMMMFASVSDIWIKTPPITQMYLLGSLVLTVLSFGLNKNRWPQLLHFDWKAILTGQVWRIYTAFLFFGPLDIFYPMTMQFVWQHMSQLEKMNYNKPEDFVILLLFGAVTLISIYSIMGISMKFLGHNLATYLVYIWARVFEGMDVNFMDLVTLKSEMIPWFFCAQTWLLEHEIPFADIIGILVGHIYHYLKEKKKLEAPEALRKWFDTDIMREKYAKFKDDFE